MASSKKIISGVIILILMQCMPAFAQGTAAQRSNSIISKMCTGLPKIYQEVLERLSQRVSVNPDSIQLKRVNLSDDYGMTACTGTFYSPRGAFSCLVEFQENGVIASACETLDTKTYTGKLRMNSRPDSLPDSSMIKKESDYDLMTGKRIRNF
jgi:hypothetical protein